MKKKEKKWKTRKRPARIRVNQERSEPSSVLLEQCIRGQMIRARIVLHPSDPRLGSASLFCKWHNRFFSLFTQLSSYLEWVNSVAHASATKGKTKWVIDKSKQHFFWLSLQNLSCWNHEGEKNVSFYHLLCKDTRKSQASPYIASFPSSN